MRTVRFSTRSWPAIAVAAVLAGCGPSAGASVAPPSANAPTVMQSKPPLAPAIPTAVPPTKAPFAFFPTTPSGPIDAATAAKLQRVLNGLVADGAPDAIAAVITANGRWAGAAGIDGPNGRFADPQDEFNIASVSKPILAALMLRLVQDGKVDLDAPLASYVGHWPHDSNGATVRQALQMRAGFGDTPGSLLAEAQARCDRVWTRKDTLASIPAPIGKPGGSFAYSNPTYKLLGYAAEHVTGTKLESAFEQQMFRPLGLDRILLQGSTHATPKPWALPIGSHGGGLALDRYGTGGTLPCVSLSTFSFATSAVASDAPSLARWAWGLFSGALIDLEYLDDMTTPFDGVHGMALELLPSYAPNLALGVHGGQVGYAAFLAILPERQAVAALFINDQEAEVEAAARKLIVALGT